MLDDNDHDKNDIVPNQGILHNYRPKIMYDMSYYNLLLTIYMSYYCIVSQKTCIIIPCFTVEKIEVQLTCYHYQF